MKGVWSNLVYLSWVKNAGFDTLISFNFKHRSDAEQKANLDEGQKYGIKVIPVLHHILVTDNNLPGAVALVNRWKDHPAWGGTVLLDEPQLNRISVARQKTFYNAIKAADPGHTHYTAFMPDPMKSEYYSRDTFDIAILNYYPVRSHGDWRAYIRAHLDAWINTTGNRDVIPNMQAFHDAGETEFANPLGTLAEQWTFWVARGMTNRGYAIYAERDGAGSGSSGIREVPGMLEEVIAFNGGTAPPPPYPCPYCPATFTSQAELNAHIASEHPTPLYPCPYCPATFTSQADLNGHIAREHPSDGGKEMVFYSEAAYDGDIYDDGTVHHATWIRVQRFEFKRRAFLSFNTSNIPADARIVKAYIKVYLTDQWGDAVGICNIDYCPYGTLTRDDYNKIASVPSIATINLSAWYGWRQSTNFTNVNKAGRSQYRIRTSEDGIRSTANFSGGEDVSNKAELHVVFDIPAPPEVITTHTTRHTCNALVEYKHSSIAENNYTLSCSHCGLSLGVKGIKGSAQVIEEPEVVTPHIVICQGCGSKLELSISSIANKNLQQYCPVCGKAAD